MKYIRTKDAIYQDLGTDNLGWRKILCGKFSQTLDPKEKIIREADSIEELCDTIVKIFDDGFTIVGDDLTTKEGHSVSYGAIWTDKGLIYVAKMNEKGELELL